jgi:uncharacterized membrane protein YczE
MKALIKRVISLYLGLFLYAVGIVLTLQANIGYGSWEVFHSGLAIVFNSKVGTMSIWVGLSVGFIVFIFGEKIGLGTISNMIFIGIFMNLLMDSNFFPLIKNPTLSIVQLIVGLFIIAIATYYYISSGFGAGPRDSLMVLLARKGKFSVGFWRTIIEIVVTIAGAFMGGMFGWGTILTAVLIGFILEVTFKFFKFDPRNVVHEDIGTSLKKLSFNRRIK